MAKTNAQLEAELLKEKKGYQVINKAFNACTEELIKWKKEAREQKEKADSFELAYGFSAKQLASEKEKVKNIKEHIGHRVISAGKPKQISINLEAICLDNNVANPESMTIAEARAVEFSLRNIMHHAKAFGE